MRRPILLLSLLLGVLALLPATAPAGEHVAPEDNFLFAPALATASLLAERGDDGAVLVSLEPAMKEDAFAQIPPKHAYKLARLYSVAAYHLGEWEASHRAIKLATGQPGATNDDWYIRFETAVMAGDGADAFASFQRLIGHDPLQGFAERQLVRFDRLLGALPNAREARLALGREMERENWDTPFVFYDPSRVWLDYALALQETGDHARARSVAGRITDPTVVMAMQADRRFDALVAATPSLQNADKAAERNLAWARDYVRDNPRMLSGRIAQARALDILDRPGEALLVIDEANRSAGRGPSREPAFDDRMEEDVLQYWRSALLTGVGRIDEAIGARTAAAACHCSSLDAVYLAQALLDAGRPGEAQRWLDGLSENGLSLEDRMALAQTRVCVAAERGKAAEAAVALDFLARNEAWAPEARINALVCTGDFDAAATAVTRQLADPQMRLDALAGLQAYVPEPGVRKHAAKLRAGWARLAGTPSVQAQVAKVGRLKTFALQRRGPFG